MLRGAGVFQRVVQSWFVRSARKVVNTAFNKHPFITNVTISFSLSGLGDVLQQHHNLLTRQQQTWDISRTRHMSCTGITVGALCHHWYVLLDRKLPGRTMQIVFKKLLMDQLLFSPICLVIFFLSLGVFKGGGWSDIFADLKNKSWRLYQAEWLVWSPAQLFNFLFLPTKFRVLYDNSISLVFDVYTSHICYDMKLEREDKDARILNVKSGNCSECSVHASSLHATREKTREECMKPLKGQEVKNYSSVLNVKSGNCSECSVNASSLNTERGESVRLLKENMLNVSLGTTSECLVHASSQSTERGGHREGVRRILMENEKTDESEGIPGNTSEYSVHTSNHNTSDKKEREESIGILKETEDKKVNYIVEGSEHVHKRINYALLIEQSQGHMR